MTEAQIQTLIRSAAASGRFDLSKVEEAEIYEDMEHFLESAGQAALEAAAEAQGIDLRAGDIREINREYARQRARAAAIKGA